MGRTGIWKLSQGGREEVGDNSDINARGDVTICE
jgi:hypothetical protein